MAISVEFTYAELSLLKADLGKLPSHDPLRYAAYVKVANAHDGAVARMLAIQNEIKRLQASLKEYE